jgi:hypothetical protein
MINIEVVTRTSNKTIWGIRVRGTPSDEIHEFHIRQRFVGKPVTSSTRQDLVDYFQDYENEVVSITIGDTILSSDDSMRVETPGPESDPPTRFEREDVI